MRTEDGGEFIPGGDVQPLDEHLRGDGLGEARGKLELAQPLGRGLDVG